MSNKAIAIDNQQIQNRIFTIRGLQVMLDSDLAEMYGVENKRLNEQVKRNIERFPEKFRFQLTEEEFQSLKFHFDSLNDDENLKSQFATTSSNNSLRSQFATLKNERGKHRKYLPYSLSKAYQCYQPC
ncbi:MAG: ORF6N domain-containing protein [Thiomargarita sp.]|nr:ORF6N domain-containing protein [Thiomargarita sp.]